MAHNWNRTGAILGGISLVVVISLGVLQYWDWLFPSARVDAEIENIQWKIGDGRLGKGPYAILKLQVSNNGSVPINITKLLTKFALGSIEADTPNIDCDTAGFTWMGVPWDTLLRGPDYVEAVSIEVTPGNLISEVVFFEPAAVLSKREREDWSQYEIFACLEVVAVDGSIERQENQIPLGWVKFDGDRILDFVRSNQSTGKVSIFD